MAGRCSNFRFWPVTYLSGPALDSGGLPAQSSNHIVIPGTGYTRTGTLGESGAVDDHVLGMSAFISEYEVGVWVYK